MDEHTKTNVCESTVTINDCQIFHLDHTGLLTAYSNHQNFLFNPTLLLVKCIGMFMHGPSYPRFHLVKLVIAWQSPVSASATALMHSVSDSYSREKHFCLKIQPFHSLPETAWASNYKGELLLLWNSVVVYSTTVYNVEK